MLFAREPAIRMNTKLLKMMGEVRPGQKKGMSIS